MYEVKYTTKEEAIKAVQKNGSELRHVSSELRNDKEVVLEAVLQDMFAYRYAGKQVKDDKEFLDFLDVELGGMDKNQYQLIGRGGEDYGESIDHTIDKYDDIYLRNYEGEIYSYSVVKNTDWCPSGAQIAHYVETSFDKDCGTVEDYLEEGMEYAEAEKIFFELEEKIVEDENITYIPEEGDLYTFTVSKQGEWDILDGLVYINDWGEPLYPDADYEIEEDYFKERESLSEEEFERNADKDEQLNELVEIDQKLDETIEIAEKVVQDLEKQNNKGISQSDE